MDDPSTLNDVLSDKSIPIDDYDMQLQLEGCKLFFFTCSCNFY